MVDREALIADTDGGSWLVQESCGAANSVVEPMAEARASRQALGKAVGLAMAMERMGVDECAGGTRAWFDLQWTIEAGDGNGADAEAKRLILHEEFRHGLGTDVPDVKARKMLGRGEGLRGFGKFVCVRR